MTITPCWFSQSVSWAANRKSALSFWRVMFWGVLIRFQPWARLVVLGLLPRLAWARLSGSGALCVRREM